MSGALEIKITISEFVTPALFQAMAAVSNPRQRAALIKRLAEDALRGNVTPGQSIPAVGSVSDSQSVASSPSAKASVFPDVPSAEPRRAVSQPELLNEERVDFDLEYLASNLGQFD
jgi:hypothetical protein